MILAPEKNYETMLEEYKRLIEKTLQSVYPDNGADTLHEAMRYSLLQGGKRLRAIMTLAFCEAAGGNVQDALPFASAIEMIHAYSLIHDDLPAMDNDILRRGKPTNHVLYGEGMAILAGDSLLTDAFYCAVKDGHPKALEIVKTLSLAAGSAGMALGQAKDLLQEGQEASVSAVREIHLKKTACLFQAACVIGLLAAQADDKMLQAGRSFGQHIGLAFQITDDLLDRESSSEQLGKTAGKDEQAHKLTWPGCVGKQQAVLDAEKETLLALEQLNFFSPHSFFLKTLAERMLQRVN